MNQWAKFFLGTGKAIQKALLPFDATYTERLLTAEQQVIPRSLFNNTRGYLLRIVEQINGCYSNGWFDACAVMIRRLTEILIIECYEKHGIEAKIKFPSGDFFYLGGLVDATIKETSWNLGRNTRDALPRIKRLGDRAAHNRRFIARKWDIDQIKDDLRITTEELLHIAHLI